MPSRETARRETRRGPAILVAGMHRSGTSAMARMMSLGGGDMAARVVTAAADNPLGFWEPRDMVALNDEILAVMGSAWDDPFGYRLGPQVTPDQHHAFVERARKVIRMDYSGSRLPVAKDPRVSLLAPIWIDAWRQEGFSPAFIIMVRSPLEVAESIAKRDGAPIAASMLAWLSNMIAVERDTRDQPRVFVSYDSLLNDGRGVVRDIGETLGLSLDSGKERAAEMDAFLTKSARHHRVTDDDWVDRPDVWPGVVQAWRWFRLKSEAHPPSAPFPMAVADDFAALDRHTRPVLNREAARADETHRTFRSMIADREAVILRLKAQVREYGVARDEALSARSAAQEEADRLIATTREEREKATTALAADTRALQIALAERDEELGRVQENELRSSIRVRDLEQALEALRDEHGLVVSSAATSRARIVELEQEGLAASAKAEAVTAQLEAMTDRLDEILSSRGWRILNSLRWPTRRS